MVKMNLVYILCLGLLTFSQTFAADLCDGQSFGSKVINPENPRSYFLCLGLLGKVTNICAEGFIYSDVGQNCIHDRQLNDSKSVFITHQNITLNNPIFYQIINYLWPSKEEPSVAIPLKIDTKPNLLQLRSSEEISLLGESLSNLKLNESNSSSSDSSENVSSSEESSETSTAPELSTEAPLTSESSSESSTGNQSTSSESSSNTTESDSSTEDPSSSSAEESSTSGAEASTEPSVTSESTTESSSNATESDSTTEDPSSSSAAESSTSGAEASTEPSVTSESTTESSSNATESDSTTEDPSSSSAAESSTSGAEASTEPSVTSESTSQSSSNATESDSTTEDPSTSTASESSTSGAEATTESSSSSESTSKSTADNANASSMSSPSSENELSTEALSNSNGQNAGKATKAKASTSANRGPSSAETLAALVAAKKASVAGLNGTKRLSSKTSVAAKVISAQDNLKPATAEKEVSKDAIIKPSISGSAKGSISELKKPITAKDIPSSAVSSEVSQSAESSEALNTSSSKNAKDGFVRPAASIATAQRVSNSKGPAPVGVNKTPSGPAKSETAQTVPADSREAKFSASSKLISVNAIPSKFINDSTPTASIQAIKKPAAKIPVTSVKSKASQSPEKNKAVSSESSDAVNVSPSKSAEVKLVNSAEAVQKISNSKASAVVKASSSDATKSAPPDSREAKFSASSKLISVNAIPNKSTKAANLSPAPVASSSSGSKESAKIVVPSSMTESEVAVAAQGSSEESKISFGKKTVAKPISKDHLLDSSESKVSKDSLAPSTAAKESSSQDVVAAVNESDLLNVETLLASVFAENDLVQSPPKSQAPQESDHLNACSGLANGSYIRDSKSCNKFYICANGRAIPRQCPGILYFDIKRKVCNYPSLVDCKNENTVEISDLTTDDVPAVPDCSTHANGEFVRHASNCGKFYVCANGRALPRQCPQGLFFDIQKSYCNFPALVDCKNKELPSPLATAEPSCEGTPEGASIRDSKLCNKYYVCKSGKPEIHYCIPGKWFNTNTQMCADKRLVKCVV